MTEITYNEKIARLSTDAVAIAVRHNLSIPKETIVDVCNYIKNNYVEVSAIKFSVTPRKLTSERSDVEIPVVKEPVAPYDEKIPVVKEAGLPIKKKDKVADKPNGLKATAMQFFQTKLENTVEKGFGDSLFEYINFKNMTDIEVYKRANLDRRLFSRIRTNNDYQPSRNTAILLAIALELELSETEKFIAKAGYALGNSSKRDLIIKYFIENRIYDLKMLNEVLFAFEEKTLD